MDVIIRNKDIELNNKKITRYSGQWRSEGGQGGPGPRAQALEGAPAQLQRRSAGIVSRGGGG